MYKYTFGDMYFENCLTGDIQFSILIRFYIIYLDNTLT